MLYSYTARNKEGTLVSDKREAADKFVLARELREDGLALFSARAAVSRFDLSSVNHMFARVKLHEKVIFTRNLSAMLRAGVSLSRAFGILERQTQNFRLKKILNSFIDDINQGQSFSDAIKKFPKEFSSLFVSMVRAGEESGGLPEALSVIGAQLDKSYAMSRKIRGALMYPAIIIVAILVIGTLMLIYVVPQLTATFREMGVELPKSTQVVILISDVLIGHTTSFVLGIIAFIAGFIFLLRTKKGSRAYEFAIIRLPLFGKIIKEVNAARTTRTLSSLLKAGVPMQESLNITRDVIQNSYYKDVLVQSEIDVQQGLSISSLFKVRTDLYPVMVGEMMEVGEETGKLSEMLDNIASFYEEEVDAATKDMSSLIEPLLMIVIGVAVGFFAVAMISPTYTILNSI